MRILILMTLVIVVSCKKPICASLYDNKNRSREIVNCHLPEYSTDLQLECKLIENFHTEPTVAYAAIEIDLAITDLRLFDDKLENITFKWDYLNDNQEHSTGLFVNRVYFETEEEFLKLKNNVSIVLTMDNSTKIQAAKLIIYNIKPEEIYRICPVFDLIKGYSICCEVELKIYEENLFELNFYMALVVIGLLVLIYALVVIGFWKFPPSSHSDSIDEILTKMPTKQVMALKQLVINSERVQNKLDSQSLTVSTIGGVDNYGIEFRDHDTYGMNDSQDTYVEITKISDPPVKHSVLVYPHNRKSKTVEPSSRIDTQSLAIKIFKEEKRRASVTPYKKAYALDNTSDGDSDS